MCKGCWSESESEVGKLAFRGSCKRCQLGKRWRVLCSPESSVLNATARGDRGGLRSLDDVTPKTQLLF